MTEENDDLVGESSMKEQGFIWTEADFSVYHPDGTLYSSPENESLYFSVNDTDDSMYGCQTSKGIKLGSTAKVEVASAYDMDEFYMYVYSKDEARKAEFYEKYPTAKEGILHTDDLYASNEEVDFIAHVFLLNDGTLIQHSQWAEDGTFPELAEGQEIVKWYILRISIKRDEVVAWEVVAYDYPKTEEQGDENEK